MTMEGRITRDLEIVEGEQPGSTGRLAGEPRLVASEGAHLGASGTSAKKVILSPISLRSPCGLDVPGSYNVNSSSGCAHSGLFHLEVKGPPPMHPEATGSISINWTWPFCVQTP